MIEQLEKNKNSNIIVFLPKDDISIKNTLEYSFKNVIVIDRVLNQNEILEYINGSKFKKIYLNGYNSFYDYLLPRLKKYIDVCWIFNSSFSNMSNNGVRNTFYKIMDYIDRDLVDYIGCINNDNFQVFKNLGFNCERINLNIKTQKKYNKKSNTIGILGNDADPRNNIYNQLASLTLVDYTCCKLCFKMRSTIKFLKKFNIRYVEEKSLDTLIYNNFVNLYINFTNTNVELIKRSFNCGVPCIVGNTDYFNGNKYLQKNLVLNSDDDINEIVDKINFVRKNTKEILEEYEKYNNHLK